MSDASLSTDNKTCPKCKRPHTHEYCDDWHYCDCGYWWETNNNGVIIRESFEEKEEELLDE